MEASLAASAAGPEYLPCASREPYLAGSTMMQDQLQEQAPRRRPPSHGRLILMGMVSACALGAGLGMWARPVSPEREAQAAARPEPSGPALQIVIEDTPAPIGPLLEVLPADVVPATSVAPPPVVDPAPLPVTPVEPVAPRRPASGLMKVDAPVVAEPMPVFTLKIVPRTKPEPDAKPTRPVKAKVAEARALKARPDNADRPVVARSGTAQNPPPVKLAKAEKAKPVRLAKADPKRPAKAEAVKATPSKVLAEAKPIVRRKPVQMAEAKPVVRRKPVQLAEAKPVVRRKAVQVAEAKPVVRRKSVQLAEAKPVVRRKAVQMAAAKPAVRRKPVQLAEAKPKAAKVRLQKAPARPVRLARNPAPPAPPPKRVTPRGEGPMRVARADACASADPGEAMVCSDSRLSARDRQLQQAYRNAEAAGVPTSALRRQQDRWRMARAATARDAPWAVEDVYEARISELNDLTRDARDN